MSGLLKGLQDVRKFLKLLLTHRMGIVGIVVFVILGIICVFAPYLRTVNPMETGVIENILIPPSSQFWFGTDHLARDIWSQTIYGARIALLVGFVAAFFTVGIGTLVGLIAGYYGGIVEEVLYLLNKEPLWKHREAWEQATAC